MLILVAGVASPQPMRSGRLDMGMYFAAMQTAWTAVVGGVVVASIGIVSVVVAARLTASREQRRWQRDQQLRAGIESIGSTGAATDGDHHEKTIGAAVVPWAGRAAWRSRVLSAVGAYRDVMGNDAGMFFARFVRHPWRVGAVAPSSAALAARVVAPLPDTGEPVVVELGAGTGVFTDLIQERLSGRGYHLVVEVDAAFAAVLRRRHPRVDVALADAARLPQLLAARGLPLADVVVSGLPWVAFTPGRAAGTLEAVASVMTPQGALTTFAYVHARWAPPARRLHAELADRFEELVLGRTVWANLPPAFVYHARRPRRALSGFYRPEPVVDEAEPVG